MKNWSWFILFILPLAGFGQQQALQNLYLFDLIYSNAAYTGHQPALTASAVLRKQWVGFNGAPETFALAVHSPFKNQNMGLGFQASYDRIGPRTVTSLALSYAYRLRLGSDSKLSFGLRAGAQNHQYDWDKIDYRDPKDVVREQGSQSVWTPAFDFGVMASNNRYFIGAELSNLSQSRLLYVNDSEARQYLHARVMGGYLVRISPKFALKPNFMFRYVPNAPAQIDLNLNALIVERFWIGAGYRHQYGLLAMAQFVITRNFELGYAYDFAVGNMRNQHAGSHELFLSYRFNIFDANFSSPRYF